MFFLILLSLCSIGSSSLINRVGIDCDIAPVPQYFADSGLGTHCRFNASYSQLDIGFIIDFSPQLTPTDLRNMVTFFTTQFNLFYGKYGPENNDVTVVASASKSEIKVPFGSVTSWDYLATEFEKINQWFREFSNDYNFDMNQALTAMDKSFNYTNNRGKLVVIVTSIGKLPEALDLPNTLKRDKNLKIFVVAFPDRFSQPFTNTYLQSVATPGWYISISRDFTSPSILQNYSNFARQASCVCRGGAQFFAQVPSPNGGVINEYYADCLGNFNETEYQVNFKDAVNHCGSLIGIQGQSPLLNSSEKFEFTKDYLAASSTGNNFWAGLNGSNWIGYGFQTVPASYIPDNNETIRQLCASQLNIPPGNGNHGILAAYEDNFVFCPADENSMYDIMCESKAVDSFDNPKLCPSPYINADTRPIQVATPCSEVLEYLYSDILVVADVSKVISVQQMNSLSQSLLKTFERLNFDRNQRHSSRISLITFATLAKVEFGFNKISNATDLANLLNLSKYRNIFDGQRNANLAFLLAKTTLFSNLSYRKPTIVFISSGFSNSQGPSQIVSLIKTLYNADVITISTTPDNNNVEKLASEGLDLNLGPELPDTFKFALTQSSCYCHANSIQFVHKDPINQAVTRYAECFFGNPIPKTPDDAFAYCSKFNSTPVIITSQAKAQFLIESVIPNEINQSPMFSLGLKRHMSYNSMFMWHEYLQDGYTYATYPPKLSSFHDLNQNCTAAVVTGEKDVGIVAMNCKDFKLPVICQKKAIDANS